VEESLLPGEPLRLLRRGRGALIGKAVIVVGSQEFVRVSERGSELVERDSRIAKGVLDVLEVPAVYEDGYPPTVTPPDANKKPAIPQNGRAY
jgi:hypothetical protein